MSATVADPEAREDQPIVAHAAYGLALWGGMVGVGYLVDAGDAAGAYHLSGRFRIVMWTLFLVGGWALSFREAALAARKRFGQEHLTQVASAVSLPGGLFFTLYFTLGLAFGKFDDYVMWMVTVASFASWSYSTGVISRSVWLQRCGLAWFAVFATGVFLRDRTVALDLLMSAGCFTLLAAPGLRLRREETVRLRDGGSVRP